MLGDSLVKAGRTTAEKLVPAAVSWAGRGAKRARRAAGWVRPHVDSAMETRLRMLLVLAGLPEPTINLIMRHPDGTWKWRLDLCYPALKVVVEYDGRQHSEDSRQWGKDLKRREELDALGWRIIVVTSDDLNHQPAQVLERVRAAMLARGATGLRRAFRTEWVRHFPRAL